MFQVHVFIYVLYSYTFVILKHTIITFCSCFQKYKNTQVPVKQEPLLTQHHAFVENDWALLFYWHALCKILKQYFILIET